MKNLIRYYFEQIFLGYTLRPSFASASRIHLVQSFLIVLDKISRFQRSFIIFGIFITQLFLTPAFALRANIDKNKIEIGIDFAGDKIKVFGARQTEGKVAIIFKSQKVHYKVYNRERVFGVWQNVKPIIFKNVYNYYMIQTEKGLNVKKDDIFREFEIGIANVNLDGSEEEERSIKMMEYQSIFLKNKLDIGKFSHEENEIQTFSDSDLFISTIEIPSNIRPGVYSLQVLLIEGNNIKEFSIFYIKIERIGFAKEIKELSAKNKPFYAMIVVISSVIISLFVFLMAKLFYRKKEG